MIDPNAVPDILALVKCVVVVQDLVTNVPKEVIDKVMAEWKRHIEEQPAESDITQHMFLLEALELFKAHRDDIMDFLNRAAKKGLFTGGDSAEYDRILSNLAGPGTDTKQ